MANNQSQTAFCSAGGGGYHSLLEPFGDFKFLHKKSSAFTLAEMMVVMLIMSIILAAMAPIMTTRIKSGRTASSSPWQWANNGVGPDAYFATAPGPRAIIGMNNATDKDNGRLIINTKNDYAHLLFKHNGETKARLYVGDYSLVLGNQSSFNDAAENTIFGVNALANNTTGANNVAIGYGAMFGNTSGNNNVGIGNEVLVENTTGSNNVALGNGALNRNAGSNNVAIGNAALNKNEDGADNVAIGNAALNKNEDGADNVAIGTSALKTNTMGGGNIAIGNEALLNNGHVTTYKKINEGEENEQEVVDKIIKGDNNTAIGHQTMQNNTSGSSNIAIGNAAMFNNTTGSRNIAIGVDTLHENKEGSDYIAIGNEALYSNTSGQHGVAIGLKALKSNTSGKHNIGIGYASLLKNEEGGQNLAIGCAALQDLGIYTTNDDNNIAIGFSSSYHLQSGSNNTALGVRSLYNIESGSNNTALGYKACLNVTSGSNITCIGANSGPKDSSSAKSHVVYLGTEEDTVYIPGNLVVGKSVVLNVSESGYYSTTMRERDSTREFIDFRLKGDNEINNLDINNATGRLLKDLIDKFKSDRRLKYVGSENKSGLDKIRQLKIFNYTFKKDEKKTPHVGVIAQDLQKIFPNAVTKGQDGFLQIRMEDMFYALVNAVKELDAKINVILSETKDLKKQVTEILRSAQNDKKQAQIDREILKQVQNDNKQLKKENAELKQTLKQVQGDNKELKARLERLEQKLR